MIEIRVNNWADPKVVSISIEGESSVIESTPTTLVAEIINAGNTGDTAQITATLECEGGITIHDNPTQEIYSMEPNVIRQL